MLFSLSDYDPYRARFYGWNFAYEEIKDLYIQKHREIAERTNTFASFLVDLTTAAMGGGNKHNEVGLDDGDGLDEMTDEQIENLRDMLGEEDFARMYPDFV